MEALELGAIDFFQKPDMNKIEEESKILIDKILQAKNAKVAIRKKNFKSKIYSEQLIDKNYLIAIGSSTGGTEALKVILERLPDNIPPILIVQHIPEVFSKALADRLNNFCKFEVVEAKNNELIEPNKVFISPGNKHMIIEKSNNILQIKIFENNLVNGHRPSVDVLFNSIADLKLKKIIGVILTGMGKDGASGLKKLKESGAKTIAQNEETCVVFGMPREAIALNAVDYIEPIENISNKIINITKAVI
jgi:two-component system chemotaxis response regulator CheB